MTRKSGKWLAPLMAMPECVVKSWHDDKTAVAPKAASPQAAPQMIHHTRPPTILQLHQNSTLYLACFCRPLLCTCSTVHVQAWMASGSEPAHIPFKTSPPAGTGSPNSKMDVGFGSCPENSSLLSWPVCFNSSSSCLLSCSCCCNCCLDSFCALMSPCLPKGHQPILNYGTGCCWEVGVGAATDYEQRSAA